MVTLSQVQASNARVATELPPGLVAVFIGATSGIGEASLKQFAKHTVKPRIYFVGRSQPSGDRIAAECKEINPDGEYVFIQADTSLIANVDSVCRQIKEKEKVVNLLFNSAGTVNGRHETTEGIPFLYALLVHSRIRFVLNLLPLLRNATVLRRVVSVFTAGKEGHVNPDDLAGLNVSVLGARGHMSSLVTLSNVEMAKLAPEVTFIHNFPGVVDTNLLVRGGQGAVISAIGKLLKALPSFAYISNEECGDRHVFLATSARYPAMETKEAALAVSLAEGINIVNGVDGKPGSGNYSVEWKGEDSGPKVVAVLADLEQKGVKNKLWQEVQNDLKRITGVEAI